MTKFFSTFIFLVIVSATITAQVGINTATPNASAALDVTSTDKGLLIPRVTSTANVTAPTAGMMVYQTGGTAGFYFYNGSWNLVGGGSGDNLGNHTATQTLNMANKNISNADTIRTDVLRAQEFFYEMPTTTIVPVANSVTSAILDMTGKQMVKITNTGINNYTIHGIAGGVHGKVIDIWGTHTTATWTYNSTTETCQTCRISNTLTTVQSGPSGNWIVRLVYDSTDLPSGGTIPGRWLVLGQTN